jgi:hypothetical protein
MVTDTSKNPKEEKNPYPKGSMLWRWWEDSKLGNIIEKE